MALKDWDRYPALVPILRGKMQGSIRQLLTDLHSTNIKLKEKLQEEKQKRVFLSTKLSDAKYSVKKHKEELDKLEKKYNRLKTFRKKKLANFLKFN